MSTPKTQSTPFKSQLRNQILKYINMVKSDGTTQMAIENLMLCVKTPSTSLEGAPQGTNARYYYAQLFGEVCYDGGKIEKFLM